MMGAAVLVLVVLTFTCMQARGQENCQAQERDMRALVVMIRQLRTEMNDTITELQRDMEEMRNKTEALEKLNREQALHQAVGFSVAGIKEVSSDVMIFSRTITNVDNSYNEATGVFTCKIPGHYYISTSLLRMYNYGLFSSCTIYKNNVMLARGYTNIGLSTGDTAAVASTYVHLAAGDTVKLGGCTETASWYRSSYSHFSGFLVTPGDA